MVTALEEHVIPVLRKRGFGGSFPHFRRITPDAVRLLTFQFHIYGGSFFIEVASCSAEAYTGWGAHIPADKVCAHDLPFGRTRLGAVDNQVDHWFKFDELHEFPNNSTTTFYKRDGDPYERAAKAVLPFLEEWWNQLPRDAGNG
jgi:hypothetical protein